MNNQIIEIVETIEGNLKIKLIDTPDNREELEYMREAYDFETVWWELLEPFSANGSYSLLKPEWIGALTEAPIICSEPMNFDEDTLLYSLPETAKTWWYGDYMVSDEFEELLKYGYVILTANK